MPLDNSLEFQDNFIVRTPLYPLDNINSFNIQLKQLNKEIEDALFLASPDLLEQIKLLKNDPDKLSEEKRRKVVVSFYKYWTRAHMRCTPYGLFAGCQLGEWGQQNNLKVPSQNHIERYTTLDINYLCTLSKTLESHPDIINQLKFYPNTSIHLTNEKARYIYYTYGEKNIRKHQLNSVDINYFVGLVLENSKDGATLEALSKPIVDEDISQADALDFLKQFVTAQLLVSELELAITGKEYLLQIIESLEGLKLQTPFIKSLIVNLNSIEKELTEVDKRQFNSEEDYQKVISIIDKLNITYDKSKLLQTVLFKPSKENKTIDKDLQNDILYAVDFLKGLTPTYPDANMDKFNEAFYKRYENKRIPLLDVLDIESGIGFPIHENATINNPLVNDINMGQRSPSNTFEIKFGKYEGFLFKQMEKCIRDNLRHIDLKPDREDYKFNSNPKNFQASIMFMGSIIGKNNNGKTQFALSSIGGRSGINLMSRFSEGSKEIESLINETVEFESKKNKDVIEAEIVHLPQARTGNVLKHPAFLKYEICYLSKPGVDTENVIELSDLEISVTQPENKARLWSKKLKKEVHPRLSNAHNYTFNALPIYRFLCTLQHHNKRTPGVFGWGFLEKIYSYFPRISFGNVVLSPEKWKLKKKDFNALIENYNGDKDFEPILQKFIKDNRLPKRFLFTDGDNQLLIDIDNSISIEMFLTLIRKRKSITLTEFLYDDFNPVISNNTGQVFMNEILGSIFNHSYKPEIVPYQNQDFTTQSVYLQSSEWLYYKIYCGAKTSDLILIEHIKPLIEKYSKLDIIDQWFFIRYHDPESHIRLRIKLKDIKNLQLVQSELFESLHPLITRRQIHGVLIDSYKRELSRYGENTMDLTEKWFCSESKTVLNFIENIEGDNGQELRWQFALIMVDEMLNQFNFDLEAKVVFMKTLATNFSNEYGNQKSIRVGIDKKYRAQKELITHLLQRKMDETYGFIFNTINSRIAISQNIANEIIKLTPVDALSKRLSSYIHMFCNRIFISNQRFHELVLYGLLSKHYTSSHARLKYDKKSIKKRKEVKL